MPGAQAVAFRVPLCLRGREEPDDSALELLRLSELQAGVRMRGGAVLTQDERFWGPAAPWGGGGLTEANTIQSPVACLHPRGRKYKSAKALEIWGLSPETKQHRPPNP